MSLVNLAYSFSSSSPLQTVASPETSTQAAANHKKPQGGGKKFNETRHPVYKGVLRRKKSGKWVRAPNKKSRLWLGTTFSTSETAAVAHDVAALALHGESAPLIFPDSVAGLPRPHSSSHQEIQRAATIAAREFCPVKFRLSHDKKVIINPSNLNSNSNLSGVLGQNNDPEEDQSQTESICNQSPTSEVGFLDEEAVFNMPALLDSMAEGMLLTPLAMKKGFNWSQYVDEGTEFNLWGD